MRLLFLILLSISLSACVGYLPVSGDKISGIDDYPEDEIELLLGKAESELRASFPYEKPAELQINNSKFLIYHQKKEFGLFFIAIAGPYGGGGGHADYVGTKTTCFKFSINEKGVFDKYEIRTIDIEKLKSPELKSNFDCRLAFWPINELLRIRQTYRDSAKDGDVESMMFLARGYGEIEYLSQYAVRNEDLHIATLLAKEFNDRRAINKLAGGDQRLLLESEKNIQKWDESSAWISRLTMDELEKLGHSGDPEIQLQLYWHSVGSNPLIWLCRSADQGHPKAQYQLGNLYWFGETELQKNHIQSYKWYQLASRSLYKARLSAKTATKELTPDELLQAERLLIQWKPGQCEKEIVRFRNSGKNIQ